MSMEWFRWYHGCISDPKFSVIARKSGSQKPVVIAVWAALLEHASQSADRGSIGDVDQEFIAAALDLPDEVVASIMAAMAAKKLISGGRIVAGNALRTESPLPYDWNRRRYTVFIRDNFTCQYCGTRAEKPHADHVTPRSRGGSDEIENLVTACPSCNLRKSDKTPEEWLQ